MQYSDFEQKLVTHVLMRPDGIALRSRTSVLSYFELHQAVTTLKRNLMLEKRDSPIAIAVSNHPAWIVLDLVTLSEQIPLVPIPFFFSDMQILHACTDAGVGTFITDQPDRFIMLLDKFIVRKSTITVANKRLMQLDLLIPSSPLPNNTAKITYTSGTTGKPKGVCLSASAMLNVANSVVQATHITSDAQHICVLPLSTLLENVAGIYAALIAGATIHLLSNEEVGFMGSQLDVMRLHSALSSTKANTAIFIPELLNALITTLESGASPLIDLRFLAVGGAAVSNDLLLRAAKLNLPVYQGYGLSECASVVSLNTTTSNQLGSVGKALNHVEIKLAEDNEVLVKGATLLGYTGISEAHLDQEWFNTGDIGSFDVDGNLYIKGRKKHIFITSYGRNVSPEWTETLLTSTPDILQAYVFGEAKPWNIALVVTKPNVSTQNINYVIQSINLQLPDYARISKWAFVNAFSVDNQQLTSNGRMKRDAIYQAHHLTINHLYKDVA